MNGFRLNRFNRTARAACAVAMLSLVAAVAAPQSALAGPTSAQVAEEIVRLQSKADKVAQRITESEDRTAMLAAETTSTESAIAELTAEVDAMDATLTSVALDQFMNGTVGAITGLLDDPNTRIEAEIFRRLAVDAGEVDIDTLDAARHDLDVKRQYLGNLAAENTQLAADLAAARTELEAELVQLEALRVRLKDQEIKRAYEALVAKRRAEEEAKRRKAQAALALAAEEAARRSRVTIIQVPGGGQPSDAPIPPPGWVCPVDGATAFGDTWASPRPNGRHHKGVDMMAASGTPLVAVVAGFVRMKTDPLGGNVASLNGVDGTRYYYAHLSSWEGGDRTVSARDVIGYVGKTGATSANHLHLEIHPHGGAAVNPYPTVRRYC